MNPEQTLAETRRLKSLRAVRALYFLYFACFGLMSVYLNVYLLKLGLSGKEIGLINSLASLLGMLGSPIWAAVSDRFGLRRMLMVINVVGAGLSGLGLAFSSYFALLMLLTVSNTFFMSSLVPLIDTMNLTALQGRSELYGRQRAWGTLGYILATTGVGFLLSGLELRLVFGAYFLIMVVMLAFVWRLPADEIHLSSSFSRKFLELIRAPAWQVTTLALFVFGVANIGMHQYLSMYLSQLGASETLIGGAWGLGAVSEAAFMAFSGGLISRIGVRKILPAAFLLYGLRMLAYTFMQDPLLALPISLMHAITFTPFWLAAVILVNQISPDHLKATGQAMLVATVNLSGVVGLPVAGIIMDSYGMPAVFRMFAVCCFAAAVIFVLGNRLIKPAPSAGD